ncbi:MAG: Sec-independent protein translocase protein TatB [Sphingomonadaceae bacterium]
MFDFGWAEILLVAAVALIVIGPKELPAAMRSLGRMVGKARAMSRHVRSGFDEMVRQAELEEMEKEWKRHNEAIMRETAIDLPEIGGMAGDPSLPPADGPRPGDSQHNAEDPPAIMPASPTDQDPEARRD